jgi:C4-dicarboxylate-specific signal transduction histidine kinase
MVVLVVLAIAAASLPAYALIHAELEHQAWARVEQGAGTSRSLLEAELARLMDLATLAAQRPTLLALTADRRTRELEAYLETFRAGADIDSIVVKSEAGDVIAGTASTGSSAVAEMIRRRIVAVPGRGAGPLAGERRCRRRRKPTVSVYRLWTNDF